MWYILTHTYMQLLPSLVCHMTAIKEHPESLQTASLCLYVLHNILYDQTKEIGFMQIREGTAQWHFSLNSLMP